MVIREASVDDCGDISVLTSELLSEIMDSIGIKAFDFDIDETKQKAYELIEAKLYYIFLAYVDDEAVGFISIYKSYALYARGAFGTIAELYVKPPYRSQKIGSRLLQRAKKFAKESSFTRLEVTTPPLPEFDKTLSFYERDGFSITGGRKMKIDIG